MGAKVSVIIPSYNHAPYIEACLRSALAQTYSDLEIILVDDRSSDDSFEIAKSIHDSRLQVYQNDVNLGTYGTLNAALRFATGDWVAVLNSDDIWAPTKLERQIAELENTGSDWSYCLGDRIDEAGKSIESIESTIPAETGTLPGLLYQNLILASSLIFSRGAVEFDETARYSGDWIVLLRLAAKGPGARVDAVLTSWRQHETNTYLRSSAQVAEEIRMRESILANLKDWMKLAGDGPAEKLATNNLCLCAFALSALHILVGNRHGAKFAAKFGFMLKPMSGFSWKRRLVADIPTLIGRNKLWGTYEPLEIDYESTRPLFDLI